MAEHQSYSCPHEHEETVLDASSLEISPFFNIYKAKQWNFNNYYRYTTDWKRVTRKLRSRMLETYRNDLQKIINDLSININIRTFATQLKACDDTINTDPPEQDNAFVYNDYRGSINMSNSSINNSFNNKRRKTDYSSSQSSNDSMFESSENESIAKEEVLEEKEYFLSLQEVKLGTSPIKTLDVNISLEERLTLSSINLLQPSPQEITTVDFSDEFKKTLEEFNKSIRYNRAMKLDHVPTLSEKEQILVSALNLMAANIRKAKGLSFPAATNVVNRGHNKEWSYICHFIVLLLGTVVLNSKLFIDYDITSNVYLDCKINVQHCRHDIILYTKDGTEIATGEVKPMNAAQESVEEDKARIAESCKKQLHKRLYKARNKKELYTYGLLIYNDRFILTISHLTERGEYQHYTAYECALASKPDKYAFMAETLEILIHFLNMAEDTVPETDEEMSNDLIWSKYVENIKPTVYMVKKGPNIVSMVQRESGTTS